jgi:hypothetical protein
MGDAKRRGTYDERVMQAIRAKRLKPRVVTEDGDTGPTSAQILATVVSINRAFAKEPTRRQTRRAGKRRRAMIRKAIRRKTLGVLA